MKPTSFLVNTARGPIVDEAALIETLIARKIAGAAIDVFDQERLPAEHAFRRLSTVLATPHMAYGSRSLYEIFYGDSVANIRAWIEGDACWQRDAKFEPNIGDRNMTDYNPYTVFGIVQPPIAASDSGMEFLNKIRSAEHPAPPFSNVTDIWPVEIELGRVVFEAMSSSRFYNPMGIVHGGWLSTLLDSAMCCAVHSMLKSGQVCTTIEMKVNFVRQVTEETGKLRCEAKIVHFGGRIATSEGRIEDSNGALIAHGSETCMIIRR